ncbi:MAG: helix-turn-helix domain-containing protein [Pirellulales bacterium]|nr:helix-turn-helix domain-containing protein [Pirellulales bacterium]
MIRTDKEYKDSLLKLEEYRTRRHEQMAALAKANLSEEQLQRVFEPEDAFYEQLESEVASYDRLRRQEPEELVSYSYFDDFGRLLIALRIYSGLSQSDLARELGIDPSQVSRDEKNEYGGITLQRARKVVDACKAPLRIMPEACLPAFAIHGRSS